MVPSIRKATLSPLSLHSFTSLIFRSYVKVELFKWAFNFYFFSVGSFTGFYSFNVSLIFVIVFYEIRNLPWDLHF